MSKQPGTIVVGVDGSSISRRALRWAAEEAELRSAALHVINVLDPHDATISDPSVMEAVSVVRASGVQEQMAAHLAQVVADELGEQPPVAVKIAVPVGHPADTLINYAANERARMLVLGNRGNGGIKKLVLGSVSEHCASHSDIPVVVIHHTDA